MSDLTLTADQVQVLADAVGPIAVRDEKGRLLGFFAVQFPTEEMIEAQRCLEPPQKAYTSAQVQARLQALQKERDRIGEFDKDYLRKFMARLDEIDPPHDRSED